MSTMIADDPSQRTPLVTGAARNPRVIARKLVANTVLSRTPVAERDARKADPRDRRMAANTVLLRTPVVERDARNPRLVLEEWLPEKTKPI